MSITNALNNAISGLTATARGAETVSANLANALTPGYARRELDLSPQNLGGGSGGVQVNGINRIISQSLLSDLRQASASAGRSGVAAGFYTTLEKSIGLPTDGDSLGARLARLDSALISATSRPDSETRLAEVAYAAGDLASRMRTISDQIQQSRTDADREIGRQVDVLNDGLTEIARLNRQIIIQKANNRDASALEDARQAAIGRISSIIPIRELPRDNGRVALFTVGGAVLLDGKEPTRISFSTAGRISADMAVDTPPVSRLMIDGEPVSDGRLPLISGGSLSALFELRDAIAPRAQGQIDAMAQELYTRFVDLDDSLPDGAAGLFTDAGGALADGATQGFAGRIALNALVDPAQSGEFWRLRDGLAADMPGPVGRSDLLDTMSRAMNDNRAFVSPGAPVSAGNLGSLAGAILSSASGQRLQAEATRTHDFAMKGALESAIAGQGVDSDKELEILLQLERAYAANARVIRAVDDMLAEILRI